MRQYFVRHGLVKYRNVPGRYAYDVCGRCLQATARGYGPSPFSGRIYGDGYADNYPASNLDPNVLSDLLPWFLAFCLIDSRDRKRQVSGGTGSILPDMVAEGDLVFFGNILSRHLIFVDTVLRVSRTVELPQHAFCFQLANNRAALLMSLQLDCTWPQFISSRSYELNLVDAEPGGLHHKTKVNPHRIILGTRAADDEDHTAGSGALVRRFLGGDGYNFIPLARVQTSANKDVRGRPEIFVKRFADASTKLSHSVTKMLPQDGESLLSLVLYEVDTLVLDPLRPQIEVQRWSPTSRCG